MGDGILSETFPEIREAVRRLCARFPGEYWQKLDRERAYPSEFVAALTEAGFLSVLIPEEYDGSGLGLEAACAVLEEIHRSGSNGGACHAQMYTMGTLLKHGSEEQKRHYLPKIASGELRLQAFGVTEPGAGTDTTRISTFARREGDDYVVNGQKIWISRAEHSDLMILLCRTTPREECAKPSDGMSVLLVDMREAVGNGLTIRPVRTMLNHATTELFFDDLRVPASALIGEEGKARRRIERIVDEATVAVCAEAMGAMGVAHKQTVEYSKQRKQFGIAIGKFQVLQHRMVDMFMEHEQSISMTYMATLKLDEDEVTRKKAVSAAKVRIGQGGRFVGQEAIQIHGGMGMTDELAVGHYFKRLTMIDSEYGNVDFHMRRYSRLTGEDQAMAAE